MTNGVEKVRQGERRGPGLPPRPRPTDRHQRCRGVCGAWVCGERVGRQMPGGLAGDDSQREVLPLGPHSVSVSKYQRYALISLLNFQSLRRERKKTNIFGATAGARHCADPLHIPDPI